MSKAGAQEYLNSVYDLYASWGVDFIKNDCVFGDNFGPVTLSNIQAARVAMDQSGRCAGGLLCFAVEPYASQCVERKLKYACVSTFRHMVYSLSPGFGTSASNDSIASAAKTVANITSL